MLESMSLRAIRQWVRWKFSDVESISTKELAGWLEDGAVKPQLLDIREQDEYDVSHLLGARWVSPDSSVDKTIARLKPAFPIVVYCSVGVRSARYARRLNRAGVGKVYNLDGSLFQWANEGRPLYQHVSGGDKRTGQVHPYNSIFGRLLKPKP